MIRRQIKDFLLKSASQYPVVLVHGPRQSGKTTLCRDTFADKPYISLENPDTRERALQDPGGSSKVSLTGPFLMKFKMFLICYPICSRLWMN